MDKSRQIEGLSLGNITLRVLFGDSTADATRISPSINGREIAVQSFFATIPSKIYYYCDFFYMFNIQSTHPSLRITCKNQFTCNYISFYMLLRVITCNVTDLTCK